MITAHSEKGGIFRPQSSVEWAAVRRAWEEREGEGRGGLSFASSYFCFGTRSEKGERVDLRASPHLLPGLILIVERKERRVGNSVVAFLLSLLCVVFLKKKKGREWPC